MEQKESLIQRWKIVPFGIGLIVGAAGIIMSPMAMFNHSAEGLANTQSKAAVLAALTPVCVARAANDPQYDVRVAALEEASSFQQTGILSDFGWATMPGSDKADRSLASACAKGVLEAYKAEVAS